MADFRLRNYRALVLGVSLLALGACTDGFDLDFRDAVGGFDTTNATRQQTERRPDADDRGIISYPSYQVAVARRGDSVADVAARVGLDPQTLASHNGLSPNDTLRSGEVLALPTRVEEDVEDSGVDIAALAGSALDRADAETVDDNVTTSTLEPVAPSREPVQHQVKRGETAYSISRLYNVSVRSLGQWNGLGPNLTIREGQYLLIPLASAPEPDPEPIDTEVTSPGEGSPTPEPPSASTPLPEETIAPEVTETPIDPQTNLGQDRTAASGSPKLLMPVTGNIIRGYQKGKTDGIDIAARAGAPVRAAGAGTIAAITRDTDGVPILVLRHQGNLLTVYANIDNVTLEKGANVSKGQTIANVRSGNPSFLHFEVREGFESVDPLQYLN